eukprot:TRINITY_DN278_c0_g1_i4.p1 TRINITY_DN278_c0_g1~~TRINITY_DN278_c0_g1_i4.p1  ORF type:complete len:767 (+),score=111.41 TRINITY_DN278_c0_g1_i4:295-2595(+)
MAATSSLHLIHTARPFLHAESTCFEVNNGFCKLKSADDHLRMPAYRLSSFTKRRRDGNLKFSKRLKIPLHAVPSSFAVISCDSSLNSGPSKNTILLSLQHAIAAAKRLFQNLEGSPLLVQCAPSVFIVTFAIWGLGPTLQFFRHSLFRKNPSNWKKSRTRHIMVSYLRPILLWSGTLLLCRAVDPLVLSSEASQAIKQRFVNFVRSLSTVLAFAYCISSLIKEVHKLLMEQSETQDTRSMGYSFISKTLYTAVWVAAVSLFMELLGFSTQRWLTAGGFGTLLLTLAGREIFTNFLSSVMIHATRPFVVNEWIQTKIEGYEVSGTVEHVGWWSPTIIRGDDREAVHIPNHKFTMSVVRNLSQKTHWRIKCHFGISHQDVNKISNIVADMRKVIAKNPHVEQQRLHRRVFFDNIDPENQSLRILVSCFVKTPHFEEYLCVKEAIFLDLLRVISHHRARLATPIRTIQKVYGDSDTQNIPFEDSLSGRPINRPLLLMESSKMSAEEKGKRVRSKEESHPRAATSETKVTEGSISLQNESGRHENREGKDSHKRAGRDRSSADLISKENSALLRGMMDGTDILSKKQLEGLDSMGLNSNDMTLLKAAFEKPPVDIPEAHNDPSILNNENTSEKSEGREKTPKRNGIKHPSGTSDSVNEIPKSNHVSTSKSGNETKVDKSKQKVPESPSGTSPKNESNQSGSGRSVSKPALEKNIILGIALDGPKRTLPIEGEIVSQDEQKELSASRNGNTKAKKDSQSSSSDISESDQKR